MNALHVVAGDSRCVRTLAERDDLCYVGKNNTVGREVVLRRLTLEHDNTVLPRFLEGRFFCSVLQLLLV
jgi:hypothetical protein